MTTDTKDKKGTSIASVERPGNLGKGLLIVIVLAVLGIFLFQFFKDRWGLTPGVIRVNGRIEGYETNIGAKIPGRVEMIANREGDVVHTNDLIVRLSDEDIQAQLRGAKARLAIAEESHQQASDQIHVVNSQIDEAKLNLSQATEDASGRIENSEATVAAAKAQLAQATAQQAEAEAEMELARIRKGRYDRLVQRGAVTKDQDDQAATTYATAQATVVARIAQVEAAKKQLTAAEGTLIQARTSRLNPSIRTAQLTALDQQLNQAKSALKAAELAIHNSKAAVDEIVANIAYLNILSPINGIVTARSVEPGAVVAAGQTVLALINLDTVYLRGYVPDSSIGRIRVGQRALVYLDSAPKKGLEGSVIEIDPEASFTPENIYFRDDRIKQVFGIKIAIKQPGGFAKPGLPADADIFTGGE